MVTAVGVVLSKPVADGPDAGRYISECGAVGWEVCVCNSVVPSVSAGQR